LLKTIIVFGKVAPLNFVESLTLRRNLVPSPPEEKCACNKQFVLRT